MFPGETAAGRTAGLDRLKLPASGDASADFIDNVSQTYSHRNLNDSRVDNVPCKGKHLGARTLFRAELTVPRGSVQDNRRCVCQSLHVVDNGRLIE